MGQVSSKKLRREARKNQRELDREIRNVERDVKACEKQETTLKTQIRKEAEAGNHDKVRQLAKQIVRAQKHGRVLDQTKGRLQDVKLELSSMVSMQLMTDTMKKMTKMMKMINRRTNAVKMMKVMTELEKQKMIAEGNQEMMDDLMDMGDEEAEDELVEKILTEVGVMGIEELEAAPQGIGQKQTQKVAQPIGMTADSGTGGKQDEQEVDDLEARLNRLNQNKDDDEPKA